MLRQTMTALLFLAAAPAALAAEHRISAPATVEKIKALVASPDRPSAQKERDQYRHPVETLEFCGIEPSMTVVEIWPGGQGAWYRRIVEPLLEAGGGRMCRLKAVRRFRRPLRAFPMARLTWCSSSAPMGS